MSVITLPWPAKPLWPNFRSRSHWPKTRALKKARADGMIAAMAAKIRAPADDSLIYVRATFFPPDRHKRDYDNCGSTLKAYFDGIADALKVNDSRFRPEMPIIAEPVKGGMVEVSLS